MGYSKAFCNLLCKLEYISSCKQTLYQAKYGQTHDMLLNYLLLNYLNGFLRMGGKGAFLSSA